AVERPAQQADEVHDSIRFLHRLAHLGGAADVCGNELPLADMGERPQEISAAGIALGDADARASAEQGLGDIAAEEPAAAEQGDQAVHENVPWKTSKLRRPMP